MVLAIINLLSVILLLGGLLLALFKGLDTWAWHKQTKADIDENKANKDLCLFFTGIIFVLLSIILLILAPELSVATLSTTQIEWLAAFLVFCIVGFTIMQSDTKSPFLQTAGPYFVLAAIAQLFGTIIVILV